MTAIAETAMSAQAAWAKVQLRSICSFLSGGTPSKQRPDFWSGSIPWVSPKDMKRPRLSDVADHISEAALATGSSLAPAGSVFVVVRGMILAKDIPVALADVPIAFNQDMKAIIPGPRVVPGFLLYALGAFKRNLHQKVGRSAHGTMTLMSHDLEQFEIPLPDTVEQRKIASMLGLLQRAIEQQERLLALTAELKKALLDRLFTYGLRGEPQKPSEVGTIPESWSVMQFEDFALLQRGFDLPRSKFRDGPYPVVGATTIIGFHDNWNVKGPGVTVVRSGSSVGKPQFVKENFWAHNVVLFVKDLHGHNPKFVYYKILNLNLTKYREGVAVPTLNRNSFRRIPVAVPERDEQDEFVRILDCVERKEDVHRGKSAVLSDLFRTLLHELMTARIRVHDLNLPELESATV